MVLMGEAWGQAEATGAEIVAHRQRRPADYKSLVM